MTWQSLCCNVSWHRNSSAAEANKEAATSNVCMSAVKMCRARRPALSGNQTRMMNNKQTRMSWRWRGIWHRIQTVCKVIQNWFTTTRGNLTFRQKILHNGNQIEPLWVLILLNRGLDSVILKCFRFSCVLSEEQRLCLTNYIQKGLAFRIFCQELFQWLLCRGTKLYCKLIASKNLTEVVEISREQ